jgi:hypothetical protein
MIRSQPPSGCSGHDGFAHYVYRRDDVRVAHEVPEDLPVHLVVPQPSQAQYAMSFMMTQANRRPGTYRAMGGSRVSIQGWVARVRVRCPDQPAVAGSHGFPASARVMASRVVRPWFAVESR